LEKLAKDETPLLCSATSQNWEAMAALAKEYNAPLAVEAGNIDEMVGLVEKLESQDLKDFVLAPKQRNLLGSLTANTTIRRMAIKENYSLLGFPIINFPGDVGDPIREVTRAMQAIGKYSSFIVLDNFDPATAYSLLVLRANLYTDPQEPIQVTPGIYELNNPGPDEIIAKDAKKFKAAEKVTKKRIVLPGHTAVLSGELEEELPDWEVKVGPKEAVDLPAYMKEVL